MADTVQDLALENQRTYNQAPRFMHMTFLKMNVVEAAKARIRWYLDTHDEVWVSFSGGKDSLVVLTLMEQIWEEDNRQGKINVKFMDEELVCDDVIDFVYWKAEANRDRYNFRWYCLEMYVGFYVMGKHKPFVSWDKEREWHRKPPDRDYVVYSVGHPTRDENENSIGRFMHTDESKKVCILLGLRADESMKRYYSVKAGGLTSPNHLGGSGVPKHLFTGKPIYDWTELDVFKFFKDYKVHYCPFYDIQVWAKTPLRVSSTMHERSQSQLFKMKSLNPRYYEQIRALYPEIETHYRYGQEMASKMNTGAYAHTFDGVRKYIEDNLDESHKKEALDFVKKAESRRRNVLAADPTKPLGGISVLQVFTTVVNGRFVKAAGQIHEITQADIDYEQDIEQ